MINARHTDCDTVVVDSLSTISVIGAGMINTPSLDQLDGRFPFEPDWSLTTEKKSFKKRTKFDQLIQSKQDKGM